MKRVILLMLFAECVASASLYPVMFSGLNISDTGWSYYNGADSPSGAYMQTSVSTNTPANINLGHTLPAGEYKVWAKIRPYYTNGAASTDKCWFEIGGYRTNVALYGENPDSESLWTQAGVVHIPTATNVLTVGFEKVSDSLNKALLIGVAVADCSVCLMDRSDILVTLPETYPSAVATSETNGPNLLANSGWETGDGGGWSIVSQTRLESFISLRTNDAHSGAYSMKVTASKMDGFLSRLFRLKPNVTNTFSVWAKAAPGNSVPPTIVIALENAYVPPSGFASQVIYSHTNTVPLDSAWHRYSVSGAALEYPKSQYRVRVQNIAGVGILTDDMQLQEGTLSDYHSGIELGFGNSGNGAVYYSDSTPTAALNVWNGFGYATNVTATVLVRNLWNAPVFTNSVGVSVSAESGVSTNIAIGSTNTGFFRAYISISGDSIFREETSFSVVPPLDVRAFEPIGSHPWHQSNTLESVIAVGLAPARTLSPSQTFRWGTIEASKDTFSWTVADDSVDRLESGGAEIFGVLGDEFNPSWSTTMASTNESLWIEHYVRYCTNTLARYTNRVAWWEIFNEPNANSALTSAGASPLPQQRYARLAKAAYEGMVAVDPSVQLVFFGGPGYSWTADAIAYWNTNNWPDWTNYVTTISAHLYPGNYAAGTYKTNVIQPYGVDVWNTETGSWSEKMKFGANSGLSIPGLQAMRYRDSARFYNLTGDDCRGLGQNLWESLGNGFTRYYYYDSRVYHSQMPGTAPTIIDYDDSVKVLGTALSYARHLMNGATSSGRLTLTTNAVDGYAFENASGSFAVVWLYDITDTPRQLAVTGEITNGLQIVDISGYLRSAGTDTVPTGIVPVYVVTTNSVVDLITALESAAISDYVDASAPNISVVSVDEISNTATLRWIAIDDESFPNDSNETAIEYSYRVNGGSWSDWTPYTTEDFTISTTSRVDIRARDEAGNIGDVFWLGDLLPPSATANTATVGMLIIGQ